MFISYHGLLFKFHKHAVQISIKYCMERLNADTGSLKPLHTLFDTYLDYMMAKFEVNRIGRNVKNMRFLVKKRPFLFLCLFCVLLCFVLFYFVFQIIFVKTLTPFCKTLKVSRQSRGLMQHGNIKKNQYLKENLLSMVLNLRIYVRNPIISSIGKTPGKF